MLTVFLLVLPWLVIVIVLLAFSLSDDLPASAVRRVFVVVGVSLFAATAGTVRFSPDAADSSYLLVAAGPLGFLLIHQILRSLFRMWKGEEPILMATGSNGSGAGRFFYEKGKRRRVTVTDYLYSFLLGVGMLLALAAAVAKVVDRAG